MDDDQPAVTDSGDKRKRQIDAGKEAAIEAEVKAARERAVIPLEIRMKQFRDMLAEKEVRVSALFLLILSPSHSDYFTLA